METASKSSTPTSKKQLIKNPYKKSVTTPKKPRKPRKRKEEEKEGKEHQDGEGTEPTPAVDQVQRPRPAQRNITEFFRPIESWPIFAFKKFQEVQPTVASTQGIVQEETLQDQVGPIADIAVTHQHEGEEEEEDKGQNAQVTDDRLASTCLLVLNLIKQTEDEEDDEVSRLATIKANDELPFEKEEDEHPEREPEFVWHPPKRRKLPPWMMLKKGKKCKPPTLRRSERMMARLGSGIADPAKVWSP
jgi:hypothetical protein